SRAGLRGVPRRGNPEVLVAGGTLVRKVGPGCGVHGRGGAGAERMMPVREGGKHAVTYYTVLETAARKVAWIALRPLTGRTHQLRAHLAAIGTPILGDGKYGGRGAFMEGDGLEKRLHLHARAMEFAKPGGGILRVCAPFPAHLEAALDAFGFAASGPEDAFPRE
ncbi:MAG: RNA pseudouridine synthase, partial [Proteobacteria bacterium]|nr:RNA pseudouridine synthase [Pseudomonadota bacterium]